MKNRLQLHILFWLAYVLFEANIEFAWLSVSPSFGSYPLYSRFFMALGEELTQLVINIPFVYLILFIIYSYAPTLRNSYFVVVPIMLSYAAYVVCHRLLVSRLIMPYYYGDEKLQPIFQINRMISSFLNGTFVVAFGIIAKQYRLQQLSREREKSLRKERLEAELKFLRTQTNPHFLFNTLNNIYALARKKSDETADVVMKLSKLLRFMLYESRKDCITVADELRVLDDYLELEKIRYNNRLKVNFIRKVDDDTQRITPLILLPFVENAFKHGASETRFDSFIDIEACLDRGMLDFKIKNSREEDSDVNISENIGLGNVRRQLELMYPEHELLLDKGSNYFSVKLTINLLKHAAV